MVACSVLDAKRPETPQATTEPPPQTRSGRLAASGWRLLRENWLWVVLPAVLVILLLVAVVVLGSLGGALPPMYR